MVDSCSALQMWSITVSKNVFISFVKYNSFKWNNVSEFSFVVIRGGGSLPWFICRINWTGLFQLLRKIKTISQYVKYKINIILFHGKHGYTLLNVDMTECIWNLYTTIKISHSETNALSPQIILFLLATSTQILNLVVDVVLCNQLVLCVSSD